uniref:CPSF_A domain-containing protein n=1 Tax=Steinernema glaseri TaxID=37863 RepID=A0A1I7Z729_9BILA
MAERLLMVVDTATITTCGCAETLFLSFGNGNGNRQKPRKFPVSGNGNGIPHITGPHSPRGDFNTSWVTSCEIINPDHYIAGENGYNLYTLKRDLDAKTEKERARLVTCGQFYLGEMINCIYAGELQDAPVDSSVSLQGQLLYGTVDGGLGVIVGLEQPVFDYLHELQLRLGKTIHNCLRISHSKYREFQSEARRENYHGFIDGDLIESLFELTREQIGQLIKGIHFKSCNPKVPSVELSVEEVMKMVEDLSRVH